MYFTGPGAGPWGTGMTAAGMCRSLTWRPTWTLRLATVAVNTTRLLFKASAPWLVRVRVRRTPRSRRAPLAFKLPGSHWRSGWQDQDAGEAAGGCGGVWVCRTSKFNLLCSRKTWLRRMYDGSSSEQYDGLTARSNLTKWLKLCGEKKEAASSFCRCAPVSSLVTRRLAGSHVTIAFPDRVSRVS